VPTKAVVDGGLIASTTAVRHGLHASVTRCLSFGPVPGELVEKHATVVEVDTAYLAECRPGATLGQAFAAGERSFAANGFYEDWKEHHQGGTTGYAGREVFAQPGVELALHAGVAVAWNPTVPGAKSEDTFLIGDHGLEQLTMAPKSPWPSSGGDIPRLGILVVD
jgi:Xaa-Pro aminopeptidase